MSLVQNISFTPIGRPSRGLATPLEMFSSDTRAISKAFSFTISKKAPKDEVFSIASI